MASLYDELQVAPTAPATELRRAYHRRARLLHPDLHRDRPPAEQAEADEALRRLNRAWDVLGDVEERGRYDRSIGLVPLYADGDPDTGAHGGLWYRPGVWLTAVGVAVVLIVVTAYAGTPGGGPAGGPTTTTSPVGRCLLPEGAVEGFGPCGPGDRRIGSVATNGSDCPAGTVAHAVRGRPVIVCLDDPTPTTLGQQ